MRKKTVILKLSDADLHAIEVRSDPRKIRGRGLSPSRKAGAERVHEQVATEFRRARIQRRPLDFLLVGDTSQITQRFRPKRGYDEFEVERDIHPVVVRAHERGKRRRK